MGAIEEKIIDVTIACLEEFGVRGTTIRKISELAGINSAAVNYYFRSKSALIDRVMAITLDNAFRWEDFRYTEEWPLRAQLLEILCHLAAGAVKFPRISQAHFYEMFVNNNYDSPALTRMTVFLDRMLAEILRKRRGLEEPEARRLLIQLISSVLLYYAAFPGLFDAFAGADMRAPAGQRAYVESVVDALFPDE
ncbi:MAG: TetR/AcrR family transcriptional regulator [Oscillospiraceae bacterium]|jgi:AcrR family transcriptional regulator|nr:TetR/AcrR family transcriptional regulator [Oscillospiraceae bacterium]